MRIIPETLSLKAFLAAGFLALLAGCGENSSPPAGSGPLYFPEINDMALVVLEGRRKEGAVDWEWLYFIDRYEVTNQEYHDFLRLTGYEPADADVFLDGWEKDPTGCLVPRKGMEDHPVVFVNYQDARKYADFHGKDLPTKAQWLNGALKTAGRYPWGDKFNAFYCNSLRTHIGKTARVGTFENGKSGWGCFDMVGNVAEWCKTRFLGEESDLVELTYYVLGGSFNDGGSFDEQDGVFNLSETRRYRVSNKRGSPPMRPRHLAPRSRNNALGFRCARNDALSYLRDTMTSRIAGLPEEERPVAFDEVALIQYDLHSVLKLIQFENAVERRVNADPSPSIIQLQALDGGGAFLLCDTEGRAGLFHLDGGLIWSKERAEEDTLFEFYLDKGPGSASNRIIMEGLWSNLLIALDSTTGKELWQIEGEEDDVVQHIVPIQDALLVNWFTPESRFNEIPIRYGLFDYFYWHTIEWAAEGSPEPFTFDLSRYFHDLIDYWALDLLNYRYASDPSLRDHLLSFFAAQPEDVTIELDGPTINIQIDVTNFGPAALYVGERIRNGFKVFWRAYQDRDGRIYQIDEPLVVPRSEPESTLILYDLDTGAVKWSTRFPGVLNSSRGVIRREKPILHDQGKSLIVVLEEEPFHSAPEKAGLTRVASIDLSDGRIISLSDLGLKEERLSDLAAVVSSPGSFMGVIDSKELLCFRLDERNASIGPRRNLGALLGSVRRTSTFGVDDTPKALATPSTVLPWISPASGESGSNGTGTRDEPPLLDRLLVFPSAQSPWLISKLDSGGRSILLKGARTDGFEEAFILEGEYTENTHLFGGAFFEGKEYMILWGSTGNLLCFNASTGAFLWKKNVMEIVELHRNLSDFDQDGYPEVLITSSSGEIRAVELESGRMVLYLKKAGSVFTCILPFLGDPAHNGELLVGVQEEGLFVLAPRKPPSSKSEEDLMFTISELERWMGRRATR